MSVQRTPREIEEELLDVVMDYTNDFDDKTIAHDVEQVVHICRRYMYLYDQYQRGDMERYQSMVSDLLKIMEKYGIKKPANV